MFYIYREELKMKKVLVVLALCLSLLSSVGSAQRYICPSTSYDETSIYITHNVEYQNFGFNVIETYKGTNYIFEFYYDATNDYIIYRYKKPGAEKWTRWYARDIYTSDSAQCLVFRDVWYYIKGYAFS